jgi:hypothetical protein
VPSARGVGEAEVLIFHEILRRLVPVPLLPDGDNAVMVDSVSCQKNQFLARVGLH